MRISDWSSDVCSSDLDLIFFSVVGDGVCNPTVADQIAVPDAISRVDARMVLAKEFGRPFPNLPPPGRWDFFEDRLRRRSIEVRQSRSEERRVGKECDSPSRSRWSPNPQTKQTTKHHIQASHR